MKNKRRLTLTIETRAAPWRRVKGLNARLNKAAAATKAALPVRLRGLACRAEATLLLTTDEEVRRLNHDFRGLNKPTNVLSFPHQTRRGLADLSKGKGRFYAGDIAIAYRYTANEARKDRKTLKNHVTHLLIHGLLHLFGYDHDTNLAAMKMERLEKKIMALMDLPDPYAPCDGQRKRRKRAKA